MDLKKSVAAGLCAVLCLSAASCDSGSTSESSSSSSGRRSQNSEIELASGPEITDNYIEWQNDGWYLHVSDKVTKYNVMALWSDPEAEKQGARLQVYEENVTSKELFLTNSTTAKDMIAFVHIIDDNGNEIDKITCGVKE